MDRDSQTRLSSVAPRSVELMAETIREVEDNGEATEVWNGPLFDIWMDYRDIVATGLREHGETALASKPPHDGDRVLDIGCGLGDATVRLGELVGAAGHANGVDVAERMIEVAIAEAAQVGIDNVSFDQLRGFSERAPTVHLTQDPEVLLRHRPHYPSWLVPGLSALVGCEDPTTLVFPERTDPPLTVNAASERGRTGGRRR